MRGDHSENLCKAENTRPETQLVEASVHAFKPAASLDIDTYSDDRRLFRKPVSPRERAGQQQLGEASGLRSGVDENKGQRIRRTRWYICEVETPRLITPLFS